MRMTLEALWLVWMVVFISGITGTAVYLALFVNVTDKSKVPKHVLHFRTFGIVVIYGGILLVSTAFLGLFADVTRRALGF